MKKEIMRKLPKELEEIPARHYMAAGKFFGKEDLDDKTGRL